MRFVIIAAPRTGSSHLVNMLGGHPEVVCHGNVFDDKMMPIFWPKSERPENTKEIREQFRELRRISLDDFLERVFATGYGRSHVGFKIFQNENDEILHKIIHDPSVRKVILLRRNILAMYSSALVARETGKWSIEKKHKVQAPPRVNFDEKKFIKFYKRQISFYVGVIKELNEVRNSFHIINYEEINNPLLLASLANFIGADPTNTIAEAEQRKQQVKQNSADILARFSNAQRAEIFLQKNDLLHWRVEGEISFNLFEDAE